MVGLMVDRSAKKRAIVVATAMIITFVFCGYELLLALNSWLAGETQSPSALLGRPSPPRLFF